MPYRKKRFFSVFIKYLISGIIGFLIALLLAPILQPFIIKAYLAIELIKSPTVDVKIFKSPIKYMQNEDINGIKWQECYRKYELILQNTSKSNIILENAHLETNFPGDIVKIIKHENSGIEYKIFAQRTVEITKEGKIDKNVVSCHLVVACKQLSPGEAVIASIIVNHRIKEDVTYFLLNPTNDYYGSYIWYKNGTPIKERIFGKIYGNETEYKTFLVNYGIYLRKAGTPDFINQSIFWFDKCLNVDSNYIHALFHKGISLGILGEQEGSIEKIKESFLLFEKTVAKDSNYEKAWNNMAAVKEYLGDYFKANDSLQPTLKEYKDALFYINKSIEINSFDESALRRKKTIQERIKNIEH